MPLMQLVSVEWWGSNDCSPEWTALNESDRPEPTLYHSVGWLYGDTPEAIVIIPHLAVKIADGEHVGESAYKNGWNAKHGCGGVTIARACIKRICDLKEPEVKP